MAQRFKNDDDFGASISLLDEHSLKDPRLAQHQIRRRKRKTLAAVSLVLLIIVVVLALMMPRPLSYVRGLALTALTSLVSAQTTNSADGLSSSAASSTVSYNTVLLNGTTTTYRAIPTLPASIDEVPGVYLPTSQDPTAVDAQQVCPGYTASNVVNNTFGFTATLKLAGAACNAYGDDVQVLNLTVQTQNADRLSVNISPAYLDASNSTQYIIPSSSVNQPGLDSNAAETAPNNDLEFIWSNTPSFNFAVVRKSTGDTLFNTSRSKLVFESQFVEFVTTMPEEYNVAGLGERIHALRLGNNYTLTIYAADAGDPIDANIYGSHPFYLDTRYYTVDASSGATTLVTNASTASSNADYVVYNHGVYLRNVHGQEVALNPTNITWRTIGGAIDLYFFSGSTQPDVTKQYQDVIGYPAMQQYFTFGYHQCRWGYTNWTELQDVVDNFRNYNIPLENIWTDIDYMNQYRDFDNDQNRFSYVNGRTFLDNLHANGQHYIPIVDSAIYIPNPNNASDAYGTYDRGNASNAFLMNPDGSQYIGSVWPGYTVFPDWRSPGAQGWWTGEMDTWHSLVDFDGIWIDMSEVSSFCVGSCGTGHVQDNPVHPPFGLPGEAGNIIYDYPEDFNVTNSTEAAAAASASAAQASANAASTTFSSAPTVSTTLRTAVTPGVRNVDFPPYALNNVNGPLPVHAVTPNATHHDGTQEYDMHNLFGHDILNATYNALLSVFPGKRPFIIGRSTFAGSGTVAGHWGGDNTSKFYYMYFSIPQALSFSLFGIPMFGVDTCGFNGNSDEELCNRWMQLSAFFPFYRNHNTLSANSQEPYIWASVATASRTAMSIRYTLLPYLYTLFYSAHTTGSTVMRALSWEFPLDGPALAAADRQFLLGGSLLITPVLEPLATSVDGVFPGWSTNMRWYDWYTGALANEVGSSANVTLDAPLGHINVHVRGGSVLPLQAPGYTTTESRNGEWSVLVALDGNATAAGSLYLDDGESLVQNATKTVKFTVEPNGGGAVLSANVIGEYVDTNKLANVTILGLAGQPSGVMLNGTPLPTGSVSWNATSGVITVFGLQNMTSNGAWAGSWTLSWNVAASSGNGSTVTSAAGGGVGGQSTAGTSGMSATTTTATATATGSGSAAATTTAGSSGTVSQISDGQVQAPSATVTPFKGAAGALSVSRGMLGWSVVVGVVILGFDTML